MVVRNGLANKRDQLYHTISGNVTHRICLSLSLQYVLSKHSLLEMHPQNFKLLCHYYFLVLFTVGGEEW